MIPNLVKEAAWLLLTLLPFLLVQRILHREVQFIFYLLTNSQEFALGLFSLLFFPGVLLHELSHYLFARLMGVQTGRFSLLPKRIPGGKIQMGYVETAQVDVLRTALIGAAPLLTGCLAVALIGMHGLALQPLMATITNGNLADFWETLKQIPSLPDFWLWFYLAFVISSTMLPSDSDRATIFPFIKILIVLFVIIILIGIGPILLTTFSAYLQQAIQSLAFIFSTSLLVHLVLFPPLRLIRLLLTRLRQV